MIIFVITFIVSAIQPQHSCYTAKVGAKQQSINQSTIQHPIFQHKWVIVA